MSEEYDRGFAAAAEYTRMCVLIGCETAQRLLMWHIDDCLKAMIADATADPQELRVRLMRAWHANPPHLIGPGRAQEAEATQSPAPETVEITANQED